MHSKLTNYLNFIKEIRKLHKMEERLQPTPKKKTITVTIKKGNNSQLIKELIRKRWWINIEEEKEKGSHNIIWSQLKDKEYF